MGIEEQDFKEKPIPAQTVYDFNYSVQAKKPEGQGQYSFEKLPLGENWYAVELTADEVLNAQGFVETSGVVDASYKFWKEYRVVTLGDIAWIMSDTAGVIPEEANYWRHKTEEDPNEKVPAIMIFATDFKGNMQFGRGALLNMGNILDGNHRLEQEAERILKMNEEERAVYRYPAYIAKINPFLASLFNSYYMVEPIINSMKKLLGKTIGDIDPHNIMNVPNRFRLLSQRLGK